MTTTYDDPFLPDEPTFYYREPREPLHVGGRVSHLVFVDGRLTDAWSEDIRGSGYEEVGACFDAQRRPVHTPPPAQPRHVQVLEWLDALVGGRTVLLELTAQPRDVPDLRDHLDPVADEQWFVVDELLTGLLDFHLSPDLAGPLREALLLLHHTDPSVVERRTPARIASGLVWVVGKANGELGPGGRVLHKDVALALGVPSLDGHTVPGRIRRQRWSATRRPWGLHGIDDLIDTGRPELLCARVRADLIRLRDDALAQQRAFLPSAVES